VMRRAIFPNNSGAVQTEYNWNCLKTNIMDHLIVSPLQKRGINITENSKTLGCHSCSKSNGMLFGNTHIKCSFGESVHHKFQGASSRHCGSYTNYFFVFCSQLHQCFTKN